jgi:AraC-like DNA-binding protein
LKRDFLYPDILVFKFEELEPAENIDETSSKDFFEIVITEKDPGNLIIRNRLYDNLDDSISFLSPNQPIRYFCNKEGDMDRAICILFKADIFIPERQSFDICNEFPFFKIHSAPLFKLQKEQIDLLYPLFEALLNETLVNDANSMRIIRSYLEIILNKCLRTMKQDVNIHPISRFETIAYQFEELVAFHSPRLKSLKDYAQFLNISAVYLAECVKKTTGRTAKQIIIDYQTIRAKYLLNQKEKTIYNVANEMGFDEVTNFTKFFKKYTGHTPSQFRKIT